MINVLFSGMIVLDGKQRVSVIVFHCKPRMLVVVFSSATLSYLAKMLSCGQLEAQALRLKLASDMIDLAIW